MRLDAVVSPIGGVISRVEPVRPIPGEPRIEMRTADVGWGPPVGLASHMAPARLEYGELNGYGAGLTAEEAETKAVMEALERYAAAVVPTGQLLWDTQRALEPDALPLDDVPRCSDEEVNGHDAYLRIPDPDAPIRWVKGLRLHDQRPIWVPAVMVYLRIWPETDAERFWIPISTGCAAQETRDAAVLAGLLECIERDAIAITWLAQIPWPRLELQALAQEHEPLSSLLEMLGRSNLEPEAFNTTGDLRVPTVYGLLRAPHDPELATVVFAGAGTDLASATYHALLEGLQSRRGLKQAQASGVRLPDEPELFDDIYHGALYMGHPSRQSAFSFLGGSAGGDPPAWQRDVRLGGWQALVDRLHRLGKDVYVVDVTTDELLEAGAVAVRVLVPGCQPLSFVHRARYLGHPRLREAVAALNLPPRAAWNRWPQPIA